MNSKTNYKTLKKIVRTAQTVKFINPVAKITITQTETDGETTAHHIR